MAHADGVETELKYLGADLAAVRQRLVAAGGRLEAARALEVNLVFDHAYGSLRRAGKLLRLRNGTELTVKTPLPDDRFKSRREVSLHLERGDAVAWLGELGYSVTWRYEKWRESWDLDGMFITLDEVPYLGHVVEIEGDGERIIETARRIGVEGLPSSAETYAALFTRYLRDRSLEWRDMTFAEERGAGPG